MVILDGCQAFRTMYGSIFGSTQSFSLVDAQGVVHHVEIRLRPAGFTRTRGIVIVNGQIEMPLVLRHESKPAGRCTRCGYDLKGCRPDGELRVKCPECGRALYPCEAGLVFQSEPVHN